MNVFDQVDLTTMYASGPDGICSVATSSKRKTYSYTGTAKAIATITASVGSTGQAVVCLVLDGQLCAADTSNSSQGSSSATCVKSIDPGTHILDIVLLDTGIVSASASVMVSPL